MKKISEYKEEIIDSLEKSIDKLEETVVDIENSIKSDDLSPQRVFIQDSKRFYPKVCLF